MSGGAVAGLVIGIMLGTGGLATVVGGALLGYLVWRRRQALRTTTTTAPAGRSGSQPQPLYQADL